MYGKGHVADVAAGLHASEGQKHSPRYSAGVRTSTSVVPGRPMAYLRELFQEIARR
jgi:hypothetical protein